MAKNSKIKDAISCENNFPNCWVRAITLILVICSFRSVTKLGLVVFAFEAHSGDQQKPNSYKIKETYFTMTAFVLFRAVSKHVQLLKARLEPLPKGMHFLLAQFFLNSIAS